MQCSEEVYYYLMIWSSIRTEYENSFGNFKVRKIIPQYNERDGKLITVESMKEEGNDASYAIHLS